MLSDALGEVARGLENIEFACGVPNLLKGGYTQVCEFHYLHHAPDGQPYADPAAMSHSLIAAARDTGIRLTLLPVLYMSGGFDGRPLGERQRRFGHSLDAYLSLLQSLRAREDHMLKVGIALHSLRAVPEAPMRELLASVAGQDLPIHIHVAEQLGEVQDSLAIRGARPVEWLLANAEVDARWTLVHATHLEPAEVQGIARRGATVAICPTTEANLGDGLFPLRAFLDAGGQWGIGSDSHVSVSPVEELRWLEYGQRLTTRRRNIAVAPGQPSTGTLLYTQALAGGLRACGQSTCTISATRAGPSGCGSNRAALRQPPHRQPVSSASSWSRCTSPSVDQWPKATGVSALRRPGTSNQGR